MTLSEIETRAAQFEQAKELMESFDYPSWQEICKSDEFVDAFLNQKDYEKAEQIANKILGLEE